MFSTFISLLTLWVPSDAKGLLQLFLDFFVIFTTSVYFRIYLAVRRHKNQIQALQVQQEGQTGEMANFASLVHSAIGVFYVKLVFLFCYFPPINMFGLN